MGTAVSLDLDGDGKWGNDDQYGYTSWSRVGSGRLYTVSARNSASQDGDDMPYFDLANTYNYDRYQAITDLYTTPGFLAPYGTAANHGGLDQFIEGRCFSTTKLSETLILFATWTPTGFIRARNIPKNRKNIIISAERHFYAYTCHRIRP